MTARTVLLVGSILFVGSMAGLLFGWMVSVIPGLVKVDDSTYVSTMQSINVEIINPAFVIPFMATPFVLLAAGIVQLRAGEQRRGWLLIGSAMTYAVGVLVVTIGGNVPLNDQLHAFELDRAAPSELAAQRSDYEGPWNRWHLLRTTAAAIAFALATTAAVVTESE